MPGKSPAHGMATPAEIIYLKGMKSEDLRRYERMLEDIEAEVGHFRLVFGCPGLVNADQARPEERPGPLNSSDRNAPQPVNAEV